VDACGEAGGLGVQTGQYSLRASVMQVAILFGKVFVFEDLVFMCVLITAVPIVKLFGAGTREEPGTLTQGVALFSLVPLVWESNPVMMMMMSFICSCRNKK